MEFVSTFQDDTFSWFQEDGVYASEPDHCQIGSVRSGKIEGKVFENVDEFALGNFAVLMVTIF